MVQDNKSDFSSVELQPSRFQKDEEAVSAIVSLIRQWVNPFAETLDLVSISTAKAVPNGIVTDLMKAHEIGQQCYATFKVERLETDPLAKKFHDPIKTNKLKTFSEKCKKREAKSNGRAVILKADRSLFGRINVIAQGQSLCMEKILSHPLGPLPWALSTPEGLLRKTNKATLATALQKNVAAEDQYPENSVVVIDGMNLVQRVKGDQVTFGEIATAIMRMALKEGSNSTRIDVVFDTYKKSSIENSERSVRSHESGHELQGITTTQKVRQ